MDTDPTASRMTSGVRCGCISKRLGSNKVATGRFGGSPLRGCRRNTSRALRHMPANRTSPFVLIVALAANHSCWLHGACAQQTDKSRPVENPWVEAAAAKVSPAVVRLRYSNSQFVTGVIVTAEGHIVAYG